MNKKRIEQDIDRLITTGYNLLRSMVIDVGTKSDLLDDFSEKEINGLPDFRAGYQSWYSESLASVKILLPDREGDFINYYRYQKSRSRITVDNYSVDDYIKGIQGATSEVSYGVNPFYQQVLIIDSLKGIFESSLFNIQTLVQAGLLDSELEAAEELNKKGFYRGAGAIAGVVLEGYLRSVCDHHKLGASKKANLGKLNDLLKDGNVIDIPNWRQIQYLIDIRNSCDHKLQKDPTKENIVDLINGVKKIAKNVF